MFVELYGDNSQSGSLKYPAKVYLKLRRMSGSYFRDGNGKMKEYRQPLGSWRTFEFNRFSVTNTVKCNQEKKKGNSKYSWHTTSGLPIQLHCCPGKGHFTLSVSTAIYI